MSRKASPATRQEVLLKLPERIRVEAEAAIDSVFRDDRCKRAIGDARKAYKSHFAAVKQMRRYVQKHAPRFRSDSREPIDREVTGRFDGILRAINALEASVRDRMLGEAVAPAIMALPLGARDVSSLLLRLKAEGLSYRDMAILLIDYPTERGRLMRPYRTLAAESRRDALARVAGTLKTLTARAAKG